MPRVNTATPALIMYASTKERQKLAAACSTQVAPT
jgi:hypothetical protein